MTKIGLFSDVHSNIEALEAVLKRLDEEGCDMLLCLGDVVGYGASPNECLQLIRDREIPCLMGNHDEYVQLLMDPSVAKLREEVRQSIEWTQSKLTLEDLKWLGKLPYRLELEDEMLCIHSSFAAGRWPYCRDEKSFHDNFAEQPVQLAFCGHSHRPMVGIDTGEETPYVDFIRPMELPSDKKVMVNVGSVGQPRDGDNRACACTYVLETRHLELLRIPYDIETAQNRLFFARRPETFALRLETGK